MVADSRPPAPPKRSFIARFFIFLFKFILLIAVIAAGGALGTLGASWINLNNVTNQAQSQRIDGLQLEMSQQSGVGSQISAMSAQSDRMSDSMGTLADDLSALSSEVGTLNQTVANQSELIAGQATQITTLTEAQTGILDDLTAAQTDVEGLAETAAGLRQNLASAVQGNSSVDNSITALEAQVATLETSLADIAASATVTGTTEVAITEADPETPPVAVADVAPAQVDLTVVRLLGHIARAKIHLLENDPASAGAAIEAAIGLSTDEGLTESLQTALASLDSKPAASSIALDSAWDALEALLDG